MRSDILDKARTDLSAVQKEHASLVHKAAATVRASRSKLEAAQLRVRDLEFSAVAALVATDKERTLQRR